MRGSEADPLDASNLQASMHAELDGNEAARRFGLDYGGAYTFFRCAWLDRIDPPPSIFHGDHEPERLDLPAYLAEDSESAHGMRCAH